MAAKDIHNLKRNQICSILAAKGWDYKVPTHTDYVFAKAIQEVMIWHARRGKKIESFVASTVIEKLCIKEKLSIVQIPTILKAVQDFLNAPMQKDFVNILFKYEIIVNTAKKSWIKCKVPYINDTESRIDVILTSPEYKTPQDLKASYEGKLAAVWGFYSRNKYPYIYNIYLENNRYKEVVFKTDKDYIRKSKIDINNMDRLFYSYRYAAPPEICSNCSRRNECPIHQ